MPQTILIAEDDADIRNLLRLYLESEGFTVLEAPDGRTALDLALTRTPDAAILDVMMPRMNGYELTRALRRTSDIPLLILSAKSQDNDKIPGAEPGRRRLHCQALQPHGAGGAAEAHLRRAGGTRREELTLGELTLDTAAMQLYKAGQPVALTPTEYKILAQLMRAPGRIFTKVQLYEAIAGEYFESNDNTMMVHISKLREKIEDDPRNPRHIVTIRGLGYKFEA